MHSHDHLNQILEVIQGLTSVCCILGNGCCCKNKEQSLKNEIIATSNTRNIDSDNHTTRYQFFSKNQNKFDQKMENEVETNHPNSEHSHCTIL